MKPKLGTSVTALFIATLTLRSTVIVAAVSYHHERTINSTEMPTQSIRAFNSPLLKRPFSVAAYPPFSFRHTNPRGDSKMRKTLFASMLAAGLVLPALAEDAGTIKLHSGWKLIQERVDKGVAYGTLWGVTFNDAGSGPLHMAPASGTYSLTQETGKGEGELIWGEGDDQLKGSFSITVADGKATGENMVKGTGKLAGISGGPFSCAFVGKPEDQQTWCTQVFRRK